MPSLLEGTRRQEGSKYHEVFLSPSCSLLPSRLRVPPNNSTRAGTLLPCLPRGRSFSVEDTKAQRQQAARTNSEELRGTSCFRVFVSSLKTPASRYTPPMPPTRDDLVAAFAAHHRQLWLVGGAMRDELMGQDHGDLDFTTDALPDEVEAIAAELGAGVTTVGKKYGTIGVFIDPHWYEITTFRGDSYTAGSRWPDVTFGRSIEEDLARRDFTVNALARDAQSGRVLDLFGGEADIRAGVIRAVGDAATRFREDPLRILRGLRFASQLDFEIDSATAAGMEETVSLLTTLSQERVTAELDKLLRGKNPARGLQAMKETGALRVALPEFASMVGCEQNRFHQFDVWGHTVATVQAIAPGDDPRLRRWTALLHDLGKPAVRHIKPNGEWGFYRHESVGADLAAELLDRLKLGRRESLTIRLLVRRHMDRPDPADRRSVRRFMTKCEGHWRDLVALKRADNASHTYDDHEYHNQLETACEEAELEDRERLKAESPLTGDDLVTMFDREPGPWIKVIKQRLGSMVLDGDLEPGDRSGAERIARQMMNAGK
ncbi:MAG: RNA nucleotidyltransferase [Anaerolinea sp.]|nr:RNA nucleotidyltransferase [Anaerolinea sp.]